MMLSGFSLRTETGIFEIQIAVEASGIKSACKDSRTECLGKVSYRVKIMLFSAMVSRERSGCNVKMLDGEATLVNLEMGKQVGVSCN